MPRGERLGANRAVRNSGGRVSPVQAAAARQRQMQWLRVRGEAWPSTACCIRWHCRYKDSVRSSNFRSLLQPEVLEYLLLEAGLGVRWKDLDEPVREALMEIVEDMASFSFPCVHLLQLPGVH